MIQQIARSHVTAADFTALTTGPLRPGFHLYELLGRGAGLKIRIPDTLLCVGVKFTAIFNDPDTGDVVARPVSVEDPWVTNFVLRAVERQQQQLRATQPPSDQDTGQDDPSRVPLLEDRIAAVEKEPVWNKKTVQSRCRPLTCAGMPIRVKEAFEKPSLDGGSRMFQAFITSPGRNASFLRMKFRPAEHTTATGHVLSTREERRDHLDEPADANAEQTGGLITDKLPSPSFLANWLHPPSPLENRLHHAPQDQTEAEVLHAQQHPNDDARQSFRRCRPSFHNVDLVGSPSEGQIEHHMLHTHHHGDEEAKPGSFRRRPSLRNLGPVGSPSEGQHGALRDTLRENRRSSDDLTALLQPRGSAVECHRSGRQPLHAPPSRAGSPEVHHTAPPDADLPHQDTFHLTTLAEAMAEMHVRPHTPQAPHDLLPRDETRLHGHADDPAGHPNELSRSSAVEQLDTLVIDKDESTIWLKRQAMITETVGATHLCSLTQRDGAVSEASAANTCAIRVAARPIQEPANMCRQLMNYLVAAVYRLFAVRVRFEEMVVDFIKDKQDRWHFLQVKHFTLHPDCAAPLRTWCWGDGGGRKSSDLKAGDDDGGTDGLPALRIVTKDAMLQEKFDKQDGEMKSGKCQVCGLWFDLQEKLVVDGSDKLAFGYLLTRQMIAGVLQTLSKVRRRYKHKAEEKVARKLEGLSEKLERCGAHLLTGLAQRPSQSHDQVKCCLLCFQLYANVHRLNLAACELGSAMGAMGPQPEVNRTNNTGVPGLVLRQRIQDFAGGPREVDVGAGRFETGGFAWSRDAFPPGTYQWRLLFMVQGLLDVEVDSLAAAGVSSCCLQYEIGQQDAAVAFDLQDVLAGKDRRLAFHPVRQARQHYYFATAESMKQLFDRKEIKMTLTGKLAAGKPIALGSTELPLKPVKWRSKSPELEGTEKADYLLSFRSERGGTIGIKLAVAVCRDTDDFSAALFANLALLREAPLIDVFWPPPSFFTLFPFPEPWLAMVRSVPPTRAHLKPLAVRSTRASQALCIEVARQLEQAGERQMTQLAREHCASAESEDEEISKSSATTLFAPTAEDDEAIREVFHSMMLNHDQSVPTDEFVALLRAEVDDIKRHQAEVESPVKRRVAQRQRRLANEPSVESVRHHDRDQRRHTLELLAHGLLSNFHAGFLGGNLRWLDVQAELDRLRESEQFFQHAYNAKGIGNDKQWLLKVLVQHPGLARLSGHSEWRRARRYQMFCELYSAVQPDTTKHVDVDELFGALQFRATKAELLTRAASAHLRQPHATTCLREELAVPCDMHSSIEAGFASVARTLAVVCRSLLSTECMQEARRQAILQPNTKISLLDVFFMFEEATVEFTAPEKLNRSALVHTSLQRRWGEHLAGDISEAHAAAASAAATVAHGRVVAGWKVAAPHSPTGDDGSKQEGEEEGACGEEASHTSSLDSADTGGPRQHHHARGGRHRGTRVANDSSEEGGPKRRRGFVVRQAGVANPKPALSRQSVSASQSGGRFAYAEQQGRKHHHRASQGSVEELIPIGFNLAAGKPELQAAAGALDRFIALSGGQSKQAREARRRIGVKKAVAKFKALLQQAKARRGANAASVGEECDPSDLGAESHASVFCRDFCNVHGLQRFYHSDMCCEACDKAHQSTLASKTRRTLVHTLKHMFEHGPVAMPTAPTETGQVLNAQQNKHHEMTFAGVKRSIKASIRHYLMVEFSTLKVLDDESTKSTGSKAASIASLLGLDKQQDEEKQLASTTGLDEVSSEAAPRDSQPSHAEVQTLEGGDSKPEVLESVMQSLVVGTIGSSTSTWKNGGAEFAQQEKEAGGECPHTPTGEPLPDSVIETSRDAVPSATPSAAPSKARPSNGNRRRPKRKRPKTDTAAGNSAVLERLTSQRPQGLDGLIANAISARHPSAPSCLTETEPTSTDLAAMLERELSGDGAVALDKHTHAWIQRVTSQAPSRRERQLDRQIGRAFSKTQLVLELRRRAAAETRAASRSLPVLDQPDAALNAGSDRGGAAAVAGAVPVVDARPQPTAYPEVLPVQQARPETQSAATKRSRTHLTKAQLIRELRRRVDEMRELEHGGPPEVFMKQRF